MPPIRPMNFQIIGPDNFPLTPAPFESIPEAVAFIPKWSERYKAQGYYRDAHWNKIPLEALPTLCAIVPVFSDDADSFAAWVRYLIHDRRLNFHPDTPFGDYVDHDGNLYFSIHEIRRFDATMEQAFMCLGDRVYEIAAPILREALMIQ